MKHIVFIAIIAIVCTSCNWHKTNRRFLAHDAQGTKYTVTVAPCGKNDRIEVGDKFSIGKIHEWTYNDSHDIKDTSNTGIRRYVTVDSVYTVN